MSEDEDAGEGVDDDQSGKEEVLDEQEITKAEEIVGEEDQEEVVEEAGEVDEQQMDREEGEELGK